MRKLFVGSMVLIAAIAARPALAQGTTGSHGFVSDNIRPVDGAATPAVSTRDWQQSSESKAQNKWARGHFGKKKPGTKKSGAKSHHPPPRKPVKKP